MRRRDLLTAAAGAGLGVSDHAGSKALAASRRGRARPWWFYAAVGDRLSAYRVQQPSGELTLTSGPHTMAEEVHSCWHSPRRGVLYVATSDQNTARRGRHWVEAFWITREGGLEPLGSKVALQSRPIDVTADSAGAYLLVAHNQPPAVSVFNIDRTGAVGQQIEQAANLDFGIYPHQVRLLPGDASVLAPARGNDPSGTAGEQPGSLQVFSLSAGRLTNSQRVAPADGLGFRPRHAAFHPNGKWMYVDLESQNRVQMYPVIGAQIAPQADFDLSTLSSPGGPGQLASAVVMHPSGRALYVANRGGGTELFEGVQVSTGENSVAVFSIDPASGEPRLMQSADVAGVHPRTLALSPDGEWLAAATIRSAVVRVGRTLTTQAAGLTLFRVGADGRLAYSAKLDLDTARGPVFWVGSAFWGDVRRLVHY